ncbi:MAG: hypothetical protein A3G34_17615 [Candidatus Lindowbacteria bacterium RIFCSPLOWO2_12_FULL_62_27]|nr:MAG: hypothetical protein A3G34_17615 [Candidatus Lindowbacteria bacterium RIFCSPLOWO2_12_FULL_62_27]
MFRVLITAAFLLVWTAATFAEAQKGGVVEPSKKLGFGARPAGMGNAYMAMADDATAVFWNPAALDLDRRYELFGQYSKTYFDKTWYNMFAYKHPVGRFGTIGGGMVLEGWGDLTRRNTAGGNIGTFDISKMNFMLGYGKQITNSLYVGSTLHVLREQIAEFSGTGFGLDVGALYRFTHAYVEFSRAYLTLAKAQIRSQAEGFYDQGAQAFQNGDLPRAFAMLEKALELDRDYKEARKLRDRTIDAGRRKGYQFQARAITNGHRAMVEFLRANPPMSLREATLSAWFNRGVELYDAGKLREAIPFFEGVIRHAQSDGITDKLSLGLNVQNFIEPQIKLKTVAEKLPMAAKLGASYRMFDWLQFALDLDLTTVDVHRIHFGLEWLPKSWLAVRTGLDNGDPTFGFGFRFSDLKFDYAILPSSLFDNFQRLSLSYEFGKSQGTVASERLQRGLTHRAKKEYPKAMQEWEEAQKLQPSNPMPRRYMAETRKDYDQNVLAPWSEAERRLAAGDLVEADRIVRSILEHDPAFDKALTAKAHIESTRDTFVEQHFVRGLTEYLIGNLSDAAREMERVLYFQPAHSAARRYLEAAKTRLIEREQFRDRYELYRKGLEEYRRGRWDEAESRLQLLVRRADGHPKAAAVLEQLAQFRQAQLEPDERKQEAARFELLAQAEFLKGQIDAAELLASHSLALDPDYAPARAILQEVQIRRAEEISEKLKLGDAAMNQGNVDVALKAWQEILAREIDHPEVRKRIEAHAGRFLSFVRSMVSESSRLQAGGDPEQALKFYNRALAVDPYNEAAAKGRGEIRSLLLPRIEREYADALGRFSKEEYEPAIATLDWIISVDPDDVRARQLRADAERRNKEKTDLARAQQLFNAGLTHYRNLHFEQAIAVWEMALSEYSSLAGARSLIEEARGRIDQAVREKDLEEKFVTGVNLYEQGNFMKAIEVWEEVRKADPQRKLVNNYLASARQSLDDQIAWHLREGDRLREQGNLLKAVESYQAAEKLHADHPEVRTRLADARSGLATQLAQWMDQGRAAVDAGQYESARAAFRAVLRVDPENAGARTGLNEIDRLSMARAEAERAIAIEGAPVVDRSAEHIAGWLQEADRYRQKVQLAVDQNRTDLAMQRARHVLSLYRQILTLDARHAAARSGETEWARRLEELQQRWKTEKSGAISQYIFSGLGHYQEGRLNEAVADWNRVLAIDSDNVKARDYIERARKKIEKLKRNETE